MADVAHRRRLVLVRHGETAWSRTGQHTGRTNIPLTEAGQRQAAGLAERLCGRTFSLVLTSPLQRAAETARLAGFGAAEPTEDLVEWNYGAYEGRTSADIGRDAPDWTIWRGGTPGGETAADVSARTDRVIARVRSLEGDALVFAHGHVLRVLAARWLGLEPTEGRLFALDPATLSTLGYEHGAPVVVTWNEGGS